MIKSIYEKTKDYILAYSFLRKLILGFLLFVITWISYDICVSLGNKSHDSNETIRTIMIIPTIVCLALGCYWKGKGTLTVKRFTALCLIAGFALRMGYAFYTQGNLRQHDVEMYNGNHLNVDGHGHFAYINTIYETGSLPSSYEWQFYHPPLWHFLVATFMHIYSTFTGVTDVAILFNAGEIVASFVACLTLYFFKEIILELTSNSKVIFISVALLAFHPQFIVMAGWMNNEGLSLMFSVMALLYTIKFHKNRGWGNVIYSAIGLGCGVMSKFSSAILAIPMGIILITDLVTDIKLKKTKTILLQALTFILICAPLALWFIIYHVSQYGIASISVPKIDPYSNLGVLDYNFFERFVIIPFWKLDEGMFCILRPNENGYIDYNVWLYTFKCSVFGEYQYWQGDIFGLILLISNIFLCLISFVTMIYVFIKEFKSEHRFMNIVMLVIYLVSIGSYVLFQITYPATCTQDFRYMTLILLPGVYFLARYLSLENEKKWVKYINPIIVSIILIFVVNSVLYYCTCR